MEVVGASQRRSALGKRPAPIARRWQFAQLARKALPYIPVAAVAVLFFAPYLWMVTTSLRDLNEAFEYPPHWLPRVWLWSNYARALTYIPFALYLRNSLVVCMVTIVGTLLSCSLTAYSLSRIRWLGASALFIVVLMTMMLPYQVTMIPLFVIFRRLGWVNTYLPLTVPAFFGNAFFIFLLRQFFLTVPEELLDAARVDGASDLRIFGSVMLPLSRPVLTTVAIFSFLFAWNDFLGPLIYLTKDRMWTLALGLQAFRTQHGMKWDLMMAASVVFTLPVLLLYAVMQRHFVRSIVTTGFR